MDKQSKIQLLTNIFSGKESLYILRNDKDDLSRLTMLELKILSDILKKPGNSNRANSLRGILTFDLERNERAFVEHLLSASEQRAPNYGQAYYDFREKDVMYLPLPEKLSIYFGKYIPVAHN